MAYMMFTEPYVTFTNIITEQRIPYIKYNNGIVGNLLPKPGSIIVWDKTSGYKTGHVAIVSKITNKYIYIGEQNWDDYVWNNPYSRRIPIGYTSCNSVYLNDNNEFNLPILGWLTLEI
jgi:glutathionylspermidine amidase/synthetase